ncbi:serine hydrolase [Oceanithermus desulfurans]|uniref:Serine hydrolase n=2 Tax=Oceanithermus desulfurans TaxID=227924 RepID=A0A511RJT3_9DEIN|nr:serine hydrolase [Oceanithermus desulfurans]MBB6029429.1 beta-lactamase class A [Oceanithermus desulfurans]GEM89915.1 serine hydrolase [Oceanithermus desulfurans NBRC 100063]
MKPARAWWALGGLVLLLAWGGAVRAGAAEEARVEALFTQKIESSWFAPGFLAKVPAAQVAAIVQQLSGSLGTFEGVRPEGADYVAVFERGEVPVSLSLDAQGRIAGLFFRPPRPRLASLAEAKKRMAAWPGAKQLLVLKDGEPLVQLEGERRLAVGSAFKLSVLAAVLDAVESGALAWDRTVKLNEDYRSLPSGRLQDWPAGTPLTLADLAGRMMAESDNTATDHLIHLLGRERVEVYAYENVPLLTTRAAFVLKANSELRRRWLEASRAERRRLVAQAEARPLPSLAGLMAALPETEVEWFYSARELCELALRALDTPLAGINPGLARRDAWKQVAFKGGSEPGVLNLTTALAGEGGSRYCVAATWNAADLDENAFYGLYGAVLERLARERP